jgi:glycosyltransferase involved in cell wall biosynthesis
VDILFLTTVLPTAPRGGGELATQAFVDALRRAGHRVVVAGYARRDDAEPRGGDDVVVARRSIESRLARRSEIAIWALTAAVRRLPYSVAKYTSRAYRYRVRQLLHAGRHDLVVLDHAQMGCLLDEIAPFGARCVLIAHNVEHQVYERLAARSGRLARAVHRREARLIEQVEERLAAGCDSVWTLTADDARFAPWRAHAIPFELPSVLEPISAPRAPQRDIGLLGTWTWESNAAGLRWFADEVVRHLPSDLAIDVAGSGANWIEGRGANLRYLGFVDDATAFLSGTRVIAIPSVTGAGIQIKTLDAIASGAPVVATPVALRGIDDPPSSVVAAGEPRAFADSLAAAARWPEELRAERAREALEWTRRRRDRFAQAVDAAARGAAPVASA